MASVSVRSRVSCLRGSSFVLESPFQGKAFLGKPALPDAVNFAEWERKERVFNTCGGNQVNLKSGTDFKTQRRIYKQHTHFMMNLPFQYL